MKLTRLNLDPGKSGGRAGGVDLRRYGSASALWPCPGRLCPRSLG